MNIQQSLLTMIGNPGQMMSSDIYNKILPDVQQDGLSQYVVRISSNDSGRSIRGLLTENFSINVDAKWEALDMINGIATANPFLANIQKFGTMFAGISGMANPANTGISTRKIYTHSGYLELDIKFRVVDWQGTGAPTKSAFLLTSMCLPKNLKNYSAGQTIEAVGDLGITEIKKVITFVSKKAGMANEDINSITSAIDGGAESLQNVISKLSKLPIEGLEKLVPQLMNLINDPQFLVMASAPSPITVQIGNYFKHNDMVAEDVKCEFSKQATSAGPLFTDFSMKVSSRQAILMGTDGTTTDQDIGLMIGGKNRVSYEESTFIGPRLPSPE